MKVEYFLILLISATGMGIGCSGSSNTDSQTNTTGTNGQLGNVSENKAAGNPGAGRPVLQFEQIPEDSQIASTKDNNGRPYEVRIWKRHPQLLKVESTGIDNNNKALTIVLRDKRVFNITTDRIVNLKLATASQVLEVAGVKPVVATSPVKSGPKKAE